MMGEAGRIVMWMFMQKNRQVYEISLLSDLMIGEDDFLYLVGHIRPNFSLLKPAFDRS